MVAVRSLLATFASLALIAQDVLAHSTQRNPISYVSLVGEPHINTATKRAHHRSTFDLTFALHDKQQEIRLSLEPNHEVIQDDTHINYLDSEGNIRHSEKVQRNEHKVFRGKTFVRREGRSEWSHAGWARITVHRDGKYPIFEGAFRVDGDNHHVQTGQTYRRVKHREDPEPSTNEDPEEYMVVWRDSDILDNYLDPLDLKRDVRGRSNCISDDLEYNAQYNPNAIFEDTLPGVSTHAMFERQEDDPGQTGDGGGAGFDLVNSIGDPRGCPDTRRIALIGIVTDCTYTAEFNSSQSVRRNIISQINAASEVYESSFNISLSIRNLTISDETCPGTAPEAAPWNLDCSSSTTINDRLSLFSEWRGRSEDPNAFWTLLTNCNTDTAVGLAWLAQVCVPGSQATSGRGGNDTVAAANVVVRTPSEWQVIAHEVGHTFGAVHDCDDSACGTDARRMQRCCPLSADSCSARGRFIMNPSTGQDISGFSPCTIGNICSAILRNNVRSDCLVNNRDVETIEGGQCGNGIVESGEDCDCGGAEDCGENSCCDPETCRFRGNAVCDPINEDCCTDSCQFASSGTVCRESTGLCDPEETCPGDASVCPRDSHRSDGDSCGDSSDNLQCASGQCTSRDDQCRAAVGSRDTTNSTSACNEGCMITCRSPTAFETEECRLMNQYFVDGTPCQSGGTCSNGVCQGASFTNDVGDWFSNNRHILIPVGASVGGLIVVVIAICCICSCCKRRKRSKAVKEPPSPPPMPGPNQSNGWSNYGGAWNNGGHNVPHPTHPPRGSPAMTQASVPPLPPAYRHEPQYPGQWHPQRPARQMSMRYA